VRLKGNIALLANNVNVVFAALIYFALTPPAYAQDSYSDPGGSEALISAANWLQGTLLGTIATAASVIAVATIGFVMLTGRVSWRHGVTVILGCFILFGAGSIVAGIHAATMLVPSTSTPASGLIGATAWQSPHPTQAVLEPSPLTLPVQRAEDQRPAAVLVSRGPVSTPRTAPVPPIYMSADPQQ
jgi:type IV secretion system protein VirB2